MGFFGRIKEGLARTTKQIVDRFDEIVSLADAPEKRSRPVDVEPVQRPEELADDGEAERDRDQAGAPALAYEPEQQLEPGDREHEQEDRDRQQTQGVVAVVR